MLTRIRRLALDGLRLFQDERLELGPPPSGPDLHLVVGDSGTGKTTLCHGLRLALYGTTPWVSAANVSLPRHEAADGPVPATVAAEVEAPNGHHRVERTLTEGTPDGSGDASVGPPRVERWGDDGPWLDVEDAETAARGLAPPETEAILVNDPGLQRVAQPTGWAPIAQGLVSAAAAARGAPDGERATPSDCWAEFRTHLERYVDVVGLASRYEVSVDDEPFGVAVAPADGSPAGRASMATGETIRFGLAMTLAAGDVAGVPQWFDAPLGRLDRTARTGAIAGLEAAAERRQVVVVPHQGSLAEHPDLRRAAATEHRLELVDTDRGTITRVDDR
ncbi:AAA family ATPase [Haloglomus litoreum]|uniref:AAA family ATPase n=1 Tax=Haloglomus litoreum TaxID=3034026 RepID=UPI0023E75ABB|nr:AAA family ATPase [Haloglomus sp. DT116]